MDTIRLLLTASLVFILSANLYAVCDKEAKGCNDACPRAEKSAVCTEGVSQLKKCLKGSVTNSTLKLSLAAALKVQNEEVACRALGKIAVDAGLIDVSTCRAMKCEGNTPARSLTDCWEFRAQALKKIIHQESYRRPKPSPAVQEQIRQQERTIEKLLSLFYASDTCEKLNRTIGLYEKTIR